MFYQPDQAALALWGGAGARHEGAAPEEAAPADQGSAEGSEEESRLWTGGSPAAPGPAGEPAALPEHWEER